MSIEEKFPIGCRVKAIVNVISAKIGATATVIAHTYVNSIKFIDITWDRNELSGTQIDGGYFPAQFEVIEQDKKIVKEPSSDYNITCQRCGAPAYQGLFKIECSKNCKE